LKIQLLTLWIWGVILALLELVYQVSFTVSIFINLGVGTTGLVGIILISTGNVKGLVGLIFIAAALFQALFVQLVKAR
jgi:hypothetical protein